MRAELKLNNEDFASISRANFRETGELLIEHGILQKIKSPEERQSYTMFITWLRELDKHLHAVLVTGEMAASSSTVEIGDKKMAAQDYFRPHVIKLLAQYFYTENPEIYGLLQQLLAYFLIGVREKDMTKALENSDLKPGEKDYWKVYIGKLSIKKEQMFRSIQSQRNQSLAYELFHGDDKNSVFLNTDHINNIFGHEVFTNPLGSFIGYLKFLDPVESV